MSERPRIVGIDLGTTNTLVATVKNRVARIVPTDRGNLVLPSVVSLTARGDVVVGAVARDQMVTNPRNTISGAKRLLGRKYDSVAVQELKEVVTWDIVPGPDGDAAVRLGERVYTLPEISALVLGQAKLIAEQFLGGAIDEAVITVPAYYTDAQRQAVKEAGRLAGLTVKRIVNEPTAAAIAYGFNRKLKQRILVYDLGGGTFDVSVLDVDGGTMEVLASGGDTFLGGLDFDNRIIDYVLETFLRTEKIDLSKSPVAMQRVRSAAEAAKIDLSVMQHVVIELPYVEERRGKPVDLRVPLGREQLDALTADLVDRTFELCDEVLTQRGLARSSVDEVILVGGQSRMPLVQQRMQQHFGKPPRKGVHPDECVALGAALLGEALDEEAPLVLVDALSMPIGYALASGRFRPIIEKNHRIPTVKSFRVPPPHRPNADVVEIDVYQGEGESIVDDEYLGTVRLPLSAIGKRLDFRLTDECLLSVEVEEGGVLREVQLATRDTPPQLKAMVAEALSKRPQPDEPQAKREGGMVATLKRFFGGRS